ncbi:MAG: PBP1A family penicillin-binding protein [Myxococcota bacterium]
MAGPSVLHRFRIKAPVAPEKLGRWLRIGAFVTLTGAVAGLSVVVGVYLYYAPSVPQFSSMADYQPKLGTRVYSADNQLIGEFARERRVLVPHDQVPDRLFFAFISAEDKRFFSHGGVDFFGILKAVVDKLLKPDQKLRGASTISQQVAKSLLATHESYEAATARKLRRKIREAILAWRLERALTKKEILYLYVNQIFLGHKAYGVQAAAEHYFRKNVWELNLAEMATLAGLPQRPSDYSPFTRPEAAASRRKYVLRRMLEDGTISQEEHDEAVMVELTVYPRDEMYLEIAPYYTEQVRREIVDRYGEDALLEDGLEVYTAVNLELQSIAQRVLGNSLHALDKRQGWRGPLAHLDEGLLRTGFINRYRGDLGLEEGQEIELKDDVLYLALVTGHDVKAKTVELNIAGREGILPLAGMRWARKPNPTQRVDLHYVKDPRRVLKVGDVISVERTTRHRLSKDIHGWEIFATVPKEGDLFTLVQEPIAQAALLSVDPRSGYVVAQVGGYDFSESSYNRAVQACREPGSAFKPIVYSAALDKLDYTASTMIDDKPLIFDDAENAVRWKPNNAGQKFRGQLPLRTCLKDSINTPAIRVAAAVGIDDIIKNARRLGITTHLKRELGTAIGSSCTTLYDLIHVFVAINQYGERRPLRYIRRVVDRYGNVLEDHTASWDPTLDLVSRLDRAYERLVTPPLQALDPQTAFLMLRLMRNVVQDGTAVAASRTGHAVAGKTGTTNDAFDAWFMGFTRDLVTGIWAGHDKKERPLGVGEQGGRTALPAWVAYTVQAFMDYTQKPPKRITQAEFAPPPGVVRVSIDPESGLLARPGFARAVMEYYRTGSEPTEFAPDKTVYDARELNPLLIDDEIGSPL